MNEPEKRGHRSSSVDGGWGWMVLIGAFVSYFVADGWSYSFGTIFTEIVDYFGESKGKTALIPTLLYGIPMIISPIICSFVNVFGCRWIGVVGGFFTGFSFFLAFFASSVDFLCLSVGIFLSVGLSMVYISSLIIVTVYFEKRRGLATGLAVTGSGLGAFAFPPLMDLLMDKYSWRGMLLITSGIGFALVPACALYRPLRSKFCIVRNDDTKVDTGLTEFSPISDNHDGGKTRVVTDSCELTQITNLDVCHQSIEVRPDLENPEQEALNLESIEFSDETDKRRSNSSSACSQTGLQCERKAGQCCDNDEKTSIFMSLPSVNDVVVDAAGDEQTRSRSSYKVSSAKSTKQINLTNYQLARNFWTELKSIPLQIFDRKLLSDCPYLIFCGANFLLFVWVSMPFVYLVDRALQLHVDFERAVFLLSIIAISRTVGQLAIGFIGDRERVNVNLLYAIGVIIVGAATGLVPLCVTYAMMCVYSVVFGLFVSVTSVLPMMCLIEIVGLGRSTQAFGFLQLVQGIGTLLGTPIAGWLFDATGDYKTSFYIAGAWIFVSGIALCPMPIIRLIKHRKL